MQFVGAISDSTTQAGGDANRNVGFIQQAGGGGNPKANGRRPKEGLNPKVEATRC
jgi:hypothetical protein